MRKRDFLKAGAAAAVLALPAASVRAQGASYNWKMSAGWGGGPLMDVGSKAFADRLEQLSGGRFKIQVFPAGALGAPLKVAETAKSGVAEMGHGWIGWDWGKDPTTVLFGGYSGSFDTERMLHWLYEGGGAEMQRQFRDETEGIVSIPLFIRTAEVFLHSRKAVKTLADLKGLKLRTAGIWLELAKDLGAAPVTTAGGDIYPMLERGAIDAVEWGTLWENIPMGFHKVARFLIYPGVHQPTAPFELSINKDAWAKLSAADKKLIETVAKLVTFESWLRIGQEDTKALDFYRKAGNTIIELDPEVGYAARKLGLEWAEKTAKEGKHPWFARVFKSLNDFEAQWKGAERWRTVKIKD